MLKLKNVSKYYYQDGVVASGFTKVNLELHIGEFVVITGESGSGKSTLLNVLSGLDTYEDGEMYINGEETSHYREEDYLEYRRKYVSNIFQNFNLVNSYTVYENIELALLMNGKSRLDAKKTVLDLINKVGLSKFKNTSCAKLSGGQKQRVAIARALANDTPIIVCDEPTGSLDSKSAKEIVKLLHDVCQDKLLIVVTHNKEEIEEYATRLIKMHDGKILENKVVKAINKDNELVANDTKNISFLSKIHLGIRNSFNLPVKFILVFIIFFLISITLTSFYAIFRQSENESVDTAYNYYFSNAKDERIVLKKNDKTSFTNDDYDKINKLANIDYLVKDDLITDTYIGMYNDINYLDGTPYLKEIKEVDAGVMPTNDNDIVVVVSPDTWAFQDESEILNKSYKLDNSDISLKVVGILYDDSLSMYNTNFYLSDKIIRSLVTDNLYEYADIEFVLNNNYFGTKHINMTSLSLKVSDKVSDNEAYIPEHFNMYCQDFNCVNKNITVNFKNIYTNLTNNLLIKKVYNYDNFTNLTGISQDNYENLVVVNQNTYDKLISKDNYQASVFVTNARYLDEVSTKLEDLGYTVLKLKDSKVDDLELVHQILNIFKLIAGIILIITLFFISYFIIKIIYKSRNSYYTTLRTLGSTKGVCVNILMNELITLATVTYIVFMILIYLVKNNIFKIDFLYELSTYVNTFEYILVYLILVLISILMSYRYGKKIFKSSIIKTYGERL